MFQVGIGQAKKSTHVRVMLANHLPKKDRARFITVLIHTNAGIASGRMHALGVAGELQFIMTMKNMRVRCVTAQPHEVGVAKDLARRRG